MEVEHWRLTFWPEHWPTEIRSSSLPNSNAHALWSSSQKKILLSPMHSWTVCHLRILGQSVTHAHLDSLSPCALLDSLSPAHSWTVCHPPTLGQSVTHTLLDSLSPVHSWTICHPPTLGQTVTHALLDSLSPMHSWTVCHPSTLGQSVTHPLLDSHNYRHLCWRMTSSKVQS